MKKFLYIIILVVATILSGCEKGDTLPPIPNGNSYIIGDNEYELEVIDRYYVIYKAADEERIMDAINDGGFVVSKQSREYKLDITEPYVMPALLADCRCAEIDGVENPYELVDWIYITRKFKGNFGASNLVRVYAGVNDKGRDRSLVERYASHVKVHVIEEQNITLAQPYIIYTLACTSRSAGNFIQISNWFNQLGDFHHAEPDFNDAFDLGIED